MSTTSDPNPPARKDEDFPKTNTLPSGWVMDELTAAYNPQAAASVPATGRTNGSANGKVSASQAAEDELFTRRLDPNPAPGDEFGMWL